MARILVAEDDDGVRHLVARALGLDGHEVVTAEDGDLALQELVKADGAFDFVLSDIRMPMICGITLAHEIAAAWPHLPILLMTGYAEQKEAAEDLAAIIEGVVEKPFTMPDIRKEVARILAAASPASEPDREDARFEDRPELPARRCA